MPLHRRRLLRAAAAASLIAATGGIGLLAQPKPRIIPIQAKKFSYEPSELTLKLNEPVIFQLTSADVVMGFSVPDFKTRGTIIPGQMTEVSDDPRQDRRVHVSVRRVLWIGTRKHGGNPACRRLTLPIGPANALEAARQLEEPPLV